MIKKRLFVHIPYKQLMENLAKIEGEDFNIEICLSGDMLDNYPAKDIDRLLKFLKERDKDCTFHAPYQDLNPGSLDREIRKITLRRFHQTLELASEFKPLIIVFHTGFDPWRYSDLEDEWLRLSLKTWEEVLRRAEGISAKLALENVFESKPQQILRIIKEFSPPLGFCFDVGHYNVFSHLPLKSWFEILHKFLLELHLHDNNGQLDEHLGLGQGCFPFDELLSLLKLFPSSALLTIEGCDEAAIRASLRYIKEYFLIDY